MQTLRLEAAAELLELSSANLLTLKLSAPKEAVQVAYADLRFARIRFIVAAQAYRETHQLMA